MLSESTMDFLRREDYTVGWICGLRTELDAARAMLDEEHPDLSMQSGDSDHYILGRIGSHNVVIAGFPMGRYGIGTAASVVTQMLGTFPFIRFGLLVGIGGGVPPKVRLGDVVVSSPALYSSGVIQWDMGKALDGHRVSRVGALGRPPRALLEALERLKMQHKMTGPYIHQHLARMQYRDPKRWSGYRAFGPPSDPLLGDEGSPDRPWRPEAFKVHYGLIASGDQVIKSSNLRDSLDQKFDGQLLCIEMEAAGLMNDFPSIVIRGICDYADEKKTMDWQDFAAATAAVVAKEFLGVIDRATIENMSAARHGMEIFLPRLPSAPYYDNFNVFGDSRNHKGNKYLSVLQGAFPSLERAHKDREYKREFLLDWLKAPVRSGNRRRTISTASAGSYEWFLQTKTFKTWRQSSIMWLGGRAGSGKTTLFTYILEHLEAATDDSHIAYYYCNYDIGENCSFDDLARTLTYQLAQQSAILPNSISRFYIEQSGGGQREASIVTILDIFKDLVANCRDCVLLVDGLDEMRGLDDVRRSVELLSNIVQNSTGRVHLLIASRPIHGLNLNKLADFSYSTWETTDNSLRFFLFEELLEYRDVIDRNMINIWVEVLLGKSDGRFLWAKLAINVLRMAISHATPLDQITRELESTSEDILSLYEQILLQCFTQYGRLPLIIVQCVAYASRPLTTSELSAIVRIRLAGIDASEPLSPESVSRICCGLITSTHTETNTAREEATYSVVHLSFREFLMEYRLHSSHDVSINALNSHIALASAFIRHMEAIIRQDEQSSNDLVNATSLQLNPYVFESWLYHVSAVEQLGGLPRDLAVAIASLLKTREICKRLIGPQNPDWLATPITDIEALEVLTDGSLLYYAARLGLTTLCDFLLETCSMADRGGRYGTPFHAAAVAGHKDVINLFISRLRTRGDDGTSVDIDEYALLSMRIEPCFEYLESLRDIESQEMLRQILVNDSESGRCGSPLQLAAYSGQLEVVIALLHLEGVRLDLECLHAAAYQGHVDVFKFLFELSTEDLKSARDDRSQTALHKAALNGKLEMIKTLTSLGFDPETLDDSRSTPLELAVERHYFDCFDWLLSKGKWNGTKKQFLSRAIDTAISSCNEFDISDYTEDTAFKPTKGQQADVRKYISKIKIGNEQHPVIVEKHYDFMSIEEALSERALTCLWREQNILRQMSHPNIVKFLGLNYNQETEQAYLYLEFGGDDMGRYVRSKKRSSLELSIAEMWSLVVDLAAALAYCHHGIHRAHGAFVAKAPWESVLHRDIKPTNILRMRDNTGLWVTKLCDLGLARLANEIKGGITRNIGTPMWYAPEIFDGESHSLKSDIYSLGATVSAFNLRQGSGDSFRVFEDLTKQCMHEIPGKRPSSLDILQVGMREKARLQNPDMSINVALIPQHAALEHYIFQAFIEILNRLFRMYAVLSDVQRDTWCASLSAFKYDAGETKWKASGMDQSLLLAMILREWTRVPVLLSNPSTPVCESWWDDQGIAPVNVAKTEGKEGEFWFSSLQN